MVGRAYDDYRARIKEVIKNDTKTFFGYADLKKKRVGYPLVMHFEGRLASGPRKSVICLRNLYNEHIPIMSGYLLIVAQNTCRMIHLLAHFNSLQMRIERFAGFGCQQGFLSRWHITDHFEELCICFRKTTFSSF
jgi:hypothetical protein